MDERNGSSRQGPIVQMSESPRLAAQRKSISDAFGSAFQHGPSLSRHLGRTLNFPSGNSQALPVVASKSTRRQTNDSSPNLSHSFGWIRQLELFPEDSIGSIDKVMTQGINNETKEPVDITGTQLQTEILRQARSAGEGPGGYRLGSFFLSPEGEYTRKIGPDDEIHGMKPLPEGFDIQALDPWLIAYIKGILNDSGQIKYINHNANAIFPTHTVIIDADCQFDRRGNVGFHKDSRGTTVFFNLTFTNEEEMQGPENYEDLEGDKGLEEKLPEEVQNDINLRRVAKSDEKDIRAPKLPPHGRVSLSDPNIFHSTPLMGHRKEYTGEETIEELKNFLKDYFPEEDLVKVGEEDLRYWYYTLLNRFNQHSFEELSSEKEKKYDKTYKAATLKRQLSTNLSEGEISQEALEEQATKPRTFIRTWVRFVPKE